MIVKMYKTVMLCLAGDKEKALDKLQALGLMHVHALRKNESEDRLELEQRAAGVDKVINILTGRPIEHDGIKRSGREIVEKALELLEEGTEFNKRLDSLKRDQEKLLPWGEFSRSAVAKLKQSGIYVYLCSGSQVDLDRVSEMGTCEIVDEEKGRFHFALFATEELDPAELPLAGIPEELSLKECRHEMDICQKGLDRIHNAMDKLASGLDRVREYQLEVEEHVDFLHSRDGMIHEGEIAYIEGFVPESEIEHLKSAARNHGWALQITEPEPGDQVPTLIKTPKVFAISKPIFDFIGISPGYNEWDISTCFLFFFTIFFAMIVGDAGYGAVFVVLALICKAMFKNPKARLPLNLFMTLSVATIIWGILNGSYFGIKANVLPEFMLWPSQQMEKLPVWVKGVSQFKGLPADEIKNKNIQYLCFFLAAIHLSLARIWKIVLYWRKSVAFALGHLGWGMLLWGNFFLAVDLIVFTGSFPSFVFWIYGIGFALILLFSVNWKDVGDVLNFPFAIIGSFVDVLSYIRLFAVGLSSYYIAVSFNNMGLMLAEISPWLIIGTVLIIVFGHLLNIALAFMGVLVHGIRLNTLEFSNHMELQWLGVVYKPFKKLVVKSNNKEKE